MTLQLKDICVTARVFFVGADSVQVEEVGVDDIYRPGSVLDIPKRPPWKYSMTKAQVEKQEEAMFSSYLRSIHSQHRQEEISYFEHNLEVPPFACMTT